MRPSGETPTVSFQVCARKHTSTRKVLFILPCNIKTGWLVLSPSMNLVLGSDDDEKDTDEYMTELVDACTNSKGDDFVGVCVFLLTSCSQPPPFLLPFPATQHDLWC